MTLRRLTRTAAMVATLVGTLALTGIGSAVAAQSSSLAVTVTGDGLQLDWDAPDAFDNLAPGSTFSTPVVLTNERDSAVRLSVSADVVADNDHGCTEPESEVDASCGAGDGELSRHIDVALTSESGNADPVRLASAAAGIGGPVTLEPGASRNYALHFVVPREVGNIAQSDAVEFVLVGTAEAIPAGTGDTGSSSDADTARTDPIAVAAAGGSGGTSAGMLSFTGVPTLALLALTLALLAAGAALVLVSRRRRRYTETGAAR